MMQSTQAAGLARMAAHPAAEAAPPRSDVFELSFAPRLRMVAWSLGLSSILWYSLIAAGHEVWKAWL